MNVEKHHPASSKRARKRVGRGQRREMKQAVKTGITRHGKVKSDHVLIGTSRAGSKRVVKTVSRDEKVQLWGASLTQSLGDLLKEALQPEEVSYENHREQ
jgi:siroheme synthase (precorrin-2 oxidase/ferrochelatase)